MKNQKFKVGDRVLAVDNIGHHKKPSSGTVVGMWRPDPKDGAFDYRVKFDDMKAALLYSNVISYIKPEKHPVIVITTDGKTTTATKRLGKQVLCSATARCSDADTFDFNTGAELAFRRLREKEMPVPKYYSGKVVCVESTADWWTVGKVYTVKNGRIIDDAGDLNGAYFTSVESLNAWAPSVRRFIQLEEG